MTEPPYRPECRGPTLLYVFQSRVLKGATPEAVAARLTDEIKTGAIETDPVLKPGARLVPKKGLRRPRLVDDVRVVDGITVRARKASKTKFDYGPSRLDVVDVDGTRTGAEKFSARECMTLRVPPQPVGAPAASEILQQLVTAIDQLAAEKPSPPPAPEKSKLEEKLRKPLVVQLRAGEDEVWLEIVPHLKTLYDTDQLPNESMARRAVADWLRTDKRKRKLARSTIYVGVKRHCAGWWD